MPNVRTVRTYLHEITHGVRVLMSLADLNLVVDTRSARGEVCSFETRERKRVRVVEDCEGSLCPSAARLP